MFYCSRIKRLVESGIYNFWYFETLEMNNDAVRQGLIDTNSEKCGYSKLFLTHFYGLFYIEIFGYLLALIILISEYFWSKLKTKINKFLFNDRISRYRKVSNFR